MKKVFLVFLSLFISLFIKAAEGHAASQSSKAHQCPYCNRSWHSESALAIHKMMHTGEKPSIPALAAIADNPRHFFIPFDKECDAFLSTAFNLAALCIHCGKLCPLDPLLENDTSCTCLTPLDALLSQP